jgi:hypothetical protein
MENVAKFSEADADTVVPEALAAEGDSHAMC